MYLNYSIKLSVSIKSSSCNVRGLDDEELIVDEAGDCGLYCGEDGEYLGDVTFGLYIGLVGEYRGDD